MDTPGELAAISHPSQLPNRPVAFPVGEVAETGLHVVTGPRGAMKKSRFVLLGVNEYQVVAKVPMVKVQGHVVGSVTVWSIPTSPEVEAMAQIRKKYPKAKLLPFQIDTEYLAPREGSGVLAVMGLFGSVALVCFGYGVWFASQGRMKPSNR